MILGDGDLRNTIEKLLSEMNLKSMVKLCGYVKNPYPYFKSCRVFCLTSIAEGFPTTIVEAMCFGKPFVSTNVAGADELSKNNKCGFIANSCEEFADYVSELILNHLLYTEISKYCLEEVKKYSLSFQINRIEKIFLVHRNS